MGNIGLSVNFPISHLFSIVLSPISKVFGPTVISNFKFQSTRFFLYFIQGFKTNPKLKLTLSRLISDPHTSLSHSHSLTTQAHGLTSLKLTHLSESISLTNFFFSFSPSRRLNLPLLLGFFLFFFFSFGLGLGLALCALLSASRLHQVLILLILILITWFSFNCKCLN